MEVVNAMIQAFAQQLTTTAANEAQFALEFKGQFEEMQKGLKLMKAFLVDSDNRKKKKDEAVKLILNDMRKLIYEADDILTDCLVRVEYREDGSCSSFSLDELLFRYQTGKKLKDINMKITNSFSKYSYVKLSEDKAYQGVDHSKEDDSSGSDTIGLEKDIKKIKGWILCIDEKPHLVGIVGMGGLGKTTIARKLFNDREIVNHFEKRIWVTVSKTFSTEEIMRRMSKELGQTETDIGQMKEKIFEELGVKNYLLVMDDVWSTTPPDWWNTLCRGKSNPTGSCIIITTRITEVANKMGVDESRIHNPELFTEKEGWPLFCKNAFSKKRGICPNDEFEKVGKEILKKCGGLPLAIKTIGALLATKVESHHQWKEISEHFRAELALETEENQNPVMASLQLSYDELPTRLKQCFLCFSIYPEDSIIGAEQLVNWWAAEGLVQGNDHNKTATELGFKYLSELISRCLVEVEKRRGYDGRVYTCRMHDLVRELAISIAEDETFCKFNGEGKQILTPDSRWLGFTSEMDAKSLKINSKLRALLVISSCRNQYDSSIEFLRSVRVLDFSLSGLNQKCIEDLLRWICSLERLAYLNLSGVADLKNLPSIQKLRNLQILVLAGCNNLVKLHPSIINLRKLMILDLGSCGLQYLPRGLGKLSHLQELSGFKVGSQANRRRCRLPELKELKQLRVLRISISNESEISVDELAFLSELEKLKVLAINTEGCDGTGSSIFKMLDQFAPPKNLQELYLRCYHRGTLPNWINPKNLGGLRYLCIEDGDLIHLRTESGDDGEFTWKLEGLCLKYLRWFEDNWETLKKDMPYIIYAEVSNCNKLYLPDSPDEPGVWRKNQDQVIHDGKIEGESSSSMGESKNNPSVKIN